MLHRMVALQAVSDPLLADSRIVHRLCSPSIAGRLAGNGFSKQFEIDYGRILRGAWSATA
jgi:hypothetical protein